MCGCKGGYFLHLPCDSFLQSVILVLSFEPRAFLLRLSYIEITPYIYLYVCFIGHVIFNIQVRIMRKRLVRKTFDMIQDISQSENKEVCSANPCDYSILFLFIFIVSYVVVYLQRVWST